VTFPISFDIFGEKECPWASWSDRDGDHVSTNSLPIRCYLL